MKSVLEALDRGHTGLAMERLLVVWRTTRRPEIADLLDLLGDRSSPPRPLPGRTVGARQEAWIRLAEDDAPLDLPTLLPHLWPKTWQRAAVLLEVLGRRRPDPRLSRPLVRVLLGRPYRSRRSEPFYRDVAACLVELGDRRVLDGGWLDEQDTDESWYVRQRLGDVRVRPLSPADQARLRELSERLEPDRDRVEQGEALLRAILEAPRDLLPRRIYADHLASHGDPQGAFVAAQLHDSPAAEREARALLAEAGDAWLPDPIAQHAQEPIFERGFVARVDLPAHLPAEALSAPCWATVHDLRFTRLSERPQVESPVLALPWIRALDVVFGLTADELIGLGPVRWHTLGFRLAPTPLPPVDLPSVQDLLVVAPIGPGGDLHPSLLAALDVGLRNVTRLRLRLDGVTRANEQDLPRSVWPAGQFHQLDLSVLPTRIQSVQLESAGDRVPEGFVHRYRRSQPGGPLDLLEVAWEGPRFRATDLRQAPPGAVRRLSFALPDRRWKPHEIQRFERFLLSFRDRTVGPLPWVVPGERPLRGIPRTLRIDGLGLADLPQLWRVLADQPFGYPFDGLSVNQGVVRRLKRDAPAHLRGWLAKSSTRTLTVVAGGGMNERALTARADEVWLHTDGFPEAGFPERWLQTVEALLDGRPYRTASLDDPREHLLGRPLRRYDLQAHVHGWFSLFGPSLAAHLPATLSLPAGVESFELAGGRAFRFGPDPDHLVDVEAADQVSALLVHHFDAALVRRFGSPWKDLIASTLGLLQEHGWRLEPDSRQLAVDLRSGRRTVTVRLHHPLEEPRLAIGIRRDVDVHPCPDGTVLRALLEDLALRLG